MNFNPNSYVGYQYPNQCMQPQQSVLNGKIVENQEIVKLTEVPIGGYGIYPKSDLSEIYVKTWEPKTRQMEVLTYKLESGTPPVDTQTQILERIDLLEQKLDKMMEQPAPTPLKEVMKNGF